MASPVTDKQVAIPTKDSGSDFGSDFSPEEEQILLQLLKGHQIEIEDNPIIHGTDQNGAQQTLRVPLLFRREQDSPLYQAARAAEEIAENISEAVNSRGDHPDCKSPSKVHGLCLTDAQASSEEQLH
jgi:exonuclease V